MTARRPKSALAIQGEITKARASVLLAAGGEQTHATGRARNSKREYSVRHGTGDEVAGRKVGGDACGGICLP